MDEVLVFAVPRPRVPALNLGLFLATIATTLYMGGTEWAGGARAVISWTSLRALLASAGQVVVAGLPFACALLAILLAHEMGHYLLARRHRVDATLPFFIPVPFGAGTLGAVIRIRSAMPSRRATLEIGAAGPIAGFAVALPLLLWGFAHAQVVAAPAPQGLASPLGWVLSWLGVLPAVGDGGPTEFGDSLATLAATWLFHGRLAPGTSLAVHPVGIAAWLGCYITALNLIPQGQLDGGHVVYALLGRERARRVSVAASVALLALGLLVSWIWAAWWVVTRFVVGTRHPPALEEEPLRPGGRALAVAALLLLVVTFVPVPLS